MEVPSMSLSRGARRSFLVPVLFVCLLLAGGVPAAAYSQPPDQYHGSYAHYDFHDYAYGSHLGNVDCSYRTLSNGNGRLESFTVRPPRVWWPDTSSSSSHQHGTVGWRFRIQQTTDPDDDPWTTVYSSSIQKKTAYEDHPGYDDADMAPFTTRSKAWSSSQTVYFRIKATIYWYHSNGTVRGSVDHWYYTYDADFGDDPAVGYCRNKVPAI
jgi:hypothetical protein